jgi:hypothetical protein
MLDYYYNNLFYVIMFIVPQLAVSAEKLGISDSTAIPGQTEQLESFCKSFLSEVDRSDLISIWRIMHTLKSVFIY